MASRKHLWVPHLWVPRPLGCWAVMGGRSHSGSSLTPVAGDQAPGHPCNRGAHLHGCRPHLALLSVRARPCAGQPPAPGVSWGPCRSGSTHGTGGQGGGHSREALNSAWGRGGFPEEASRRQLEETVQPGLGVALSLSLPGTGPDPRTKRPHSVPPAQTRFG